MAKDSIRNFSSALQNNTVDEKALWSICVEIKHLFHLFSTQAWSSSSSLLVKWKDLQMGSASFFDGVKKWFHLIWVSPITFPSFVAILNHFLLFCAFTKFRAIEMLWRIKLKYTCTDTCCYKAWKNNFPLYLSLTENSLCPEVALKLLSLPSPPRALVSF